MNVKPVGEEFLNEILAVENASFSDPWSAESFREAFASPVTTVYGAFDEEGALIGFACMCVIADEAELYDIAALPTHRLRGVGQALMSRMLGDCERLGVESMYLEVRASNLPAFSLYLKNGFEPKGVRRNYYTDPAEDAVVMKKSF